MKTKIVDIKIKRLTDTAKIPTKGTDGAAAYDLYSDGEPVKLGPISTYAISTGISIAIPKGYCGLVLPRSGLSLKSPLRIANAPGLIDSDYRGEVKIIVDNLAQQGFWDIQPGTRIAQLLIMPYPEIRFQETDDLGSTDRGENGFGSTGTN